MKSVFATVCNVYRIIHCKIQMICLINSQKLIKVLLDFWFTSGQENFGQAQVSTLKNMGVFRFILLQ